ncbi:hypothetical protein D3C77_663200 [compost metagenome]
MSTANHRVKEWQFSLVTPKGVDHLHWQAFPIAAFSLAVPGLVYLSAGYADRSAAAGHRAVAGRTLELRARPKTRLPEPS